MSTDQSLIWSGLSEKESLSNILRIFNNSALWRINLAELINKLVDDNQTQTIHVLEAGSSYGLTSALLNSTFSINLLDIDDIALQKAKTLFNHINRNVNIIHYNIFDLDKLGSKYDIVFNSGVIEHFDYDDRNRLIFNMATVVHENGYVVIGYPNHESFPYRLGYLYKLVTKKWIYPKENKIKIDTQKFTDYNLQLQGIYDFDDITIYDFLPRLIRRILKKVTGLVHFQGYLKVAIFKKTDASISSNPIR